jgi:hypothetical protein
MTWKTNKPNINSTGVLIQTDLRYQNLSTEETAQQTEVDSLSEKDENEETCT